MHVYGIPNCTTVKKARAWLDEHGFAYTFHDFKKQPPSQEQLAAWSARVGWDKLLNRQGTTWRQLPDVLKANINTPAAAFALMIDKPSSIKRPVVEYQGRVWIGFNPADYAALTGA
jgi:arsenate reductase